jgi:predicted phage terminase large subunit-like protein
MTTGNPPFAKKVEFIGPASDKQQLMLNITADIAVIGGAAGSGKSHIALLYPLKYRNDPYFRGVIFRQTTKELEDLWDRAVEMYPKLYPKDAKGRSPVKIHQQKMRITFPSGGTVTFSYLEHEKDKYKHQGKEYSFVLFDEATHFTQTQIEYLRTRLRSSRSASPTQMILTCNPDPDSVICSWIEWYLQPEGLPDQSKDGFVRYFVVQSGDYIWSDTREELEAIYGSGPDSGIQTFTFISATCYDNPVLLENDPGYVSRLKANNEVDVQRLLYGNWKVRPSNAGIMKRDWFAEATEEPAWTDIVKTVRAFDFAGTLKSDANPSPDYTACVKMSKLKDGTYFIHEVRRCRIRFGQWVDWIITCAADDKPGTDLIIPIDPNPMAKSASEMLARTLSEHGFFVKRFKTSGKKIDRARPFASMLMNGGVSILKNSCVDEENNVNYDNSFYYRECEAFDGEKRKGENGHDDMVDAASDAFMALAQKIVIPNITHGLKQFNTSYHNPFAPANNPFKR